MRKVSQVICLAVVFALLITGAAWADTETTCTHENLQVRGQYVYSGMTYAQVNSAVHHATGTATYWDYCPDCRIYMNEEQVPIDQDEKHMYSCTDYATSEYTCFKCQQVCEHEYENGVCKNCGHPCSHNGLETAQKLTREAQKASSSGETYHRIYTCMAEYQVCPVCGDEIETGIQTDIVTIRMEAHEYDERGICIVCGRMCDHEGIETAAETRTPAEGTHAGKIDAEYHQNGTCVRVERECPVCHAMVLKEYELTTAAAGSEPEKHQFDYRGQCYDCGYQCLHPAWENGICTACGMKCRHEDGDYVWEWAEGTVFNDIEGNEYSHSVTGTETQTYRCHICGEDVNSYIYERNEDYEHHDYYMQPIGEEAAVCGECGHVNKCAHVYDNHYFHTEWEGDVQYTAIDAQSHRREGAATIYEVCGSCGMCFSITTENNHSETEKHSYSDDGICYECGYVCHHENGYSEQGWLYDRSGATYTQKDADQHTVTGTGTSRVRCKDCGQEQSYTENTEVTLDEEHSFSEYVCEYCGYECKHGDSRKVTEETRNEYEWISTTQHAIITIETSHEECTKCWYCGEPITAVTAEEPEDHEDEDEDGICDICGQSISGSWLWDLNNGKLHITGNGEIAGFEQVSDLPWYNAIGTIDRVFIEGDFTVIGPNVLSGLNSETRIDLRQRKMPTMDTATVSGVCRYYSTDESWQDAPESWIYLPIYNPDQESVNQIEYKAQSGWGTGRTDATGHTNYPLTARQAVEISYSGRNVVLYAIPTAEADMAVITDHWDTTWMISFQADCSGSMNLEVGADTSSGLCFDIFAPNLTLTIDGSRIESMNRMMIGAGQVTYTGRIRDLYLRDTREGYTAPILTVNGDVDELNFCDNTSDTPYRGTLTVNGTIGKGSVYGSTTINIPNISDAVAFPDMVKAMITNVNQETPVVLNGTLNVDGAQSMDGMTWEDFNLRYHLMPGGWRLDLRPKEDSPFEYGTSIDDVEAYNDAFDTDDILWGENTQVYVWDVRDLGTLEFNGGANGEGLGELTLRCCIAEVNCPVNRLNVDQLNSDTDATTVTINSAITTLGMTMRKSGNTVTLGEGGSVGGGWWSRYFGEYRYFGPITEAGSIYSDGQLKVMSWKDGQSIRALLPSDDEVTQAAGQAATIDLNEANESDLSDNEYDKLQEYLETKGSGSVAAIFDISVMGVDEDGDIVPGAEISETNNALELTVSNEANGEAYILRLHENADGSVSAEEMCAPTDEDELTFASQLFSKYIIIDNTSTAPEGEWDWRIANGVLIISGSGPMDDYETAADAPWYEQRAGIQEIVLESGISHIGANAFGGMTQTVRVDFNQRVLPDMGENAFGGSNVIYRYYRSGDSWTGTFGAASSKWVYMPANNQGSEYENIRYYRNSETFGTGWTIYTQEDGEFAVTAEQAEEFSFRGRAIFLYAIPEEQADRDMYEAHWDVVEALYIFPEGSGTYNLTIPETARSMAMSFNAPRWTLNVDASAATEDVFALVQAGGGTLNMTASKIYTLFLGDYTYGEPAPEGQVTIHSNVETLNYYNSSNDDRKFAGNATIDGIIEVGYEYGTATAEIPNIPNITAPQMIVGKFENVNQTEPIVLNSALNVTGAETFGTYTPDNCWLYYQLYNNQGQDEWRLQISPRTGDNAQPVHIFIADYNPNFTMDDICWGEYTGLTFFKARPGQTIIVNGADGKGLDDVAITETNVEINCPVDWIEVDDWSRDGSPFQVTINNTVNRFDSRLNWKKCSVTLGENGMIYSGFLHRPLYNDLYFENIHGSTTVMQNSQLTVLSHQANQRIATILPDESTLTNSAGLGAGQVAIMEAKDAEELTEAEEDAMAQANIQGTAAETFDVSVAAYEMDETGSAGDRIGTITELESAVTITVQNVTGNEAFVVRLHEDENNHVTATCMTEPSFGRVFTFESDLFSKYVLVTTGTTLDPSTLRTLRLPEGLTRIEEEAFRGGYFQAVIIPDSCTYIGKDAFAECGEVIYVSYKADIKEIVEEAFADCDILVWQER